MANTGQNELIGVIRARSHTYKPVTDQWVKRDAILAIPSFHGNDGHRFKGIKEESESEATVEDVMIVMKGSRRSGMSVASLYCEAIVNDALLKTKQKQNNNNP